MKKNLILFCSMALVAASSCSVEEAAPITTDPRVPMTFTAGLNTKTSIAPSADGYAVSWSAGDAISIFDGTNNNKFDLTDGADSPNATFSGSAVPVDTYYALYPYSATASLSGTTISATLPTEQYAGENTFGDGVNPSVAVSNGNQLAFYNVAGVLRVTLPDNYAGDKTVREIQMSADQSMTGDYTVAMGTTPYAAAAVTSTSATGVRLIAQDGGALSGNSFYVVLLPGTYTNVTLTVICTDNSYLTGTLASFTVKAGEVRRQEVSLDAATVNNNGLYGLFTAGKDIYIGGKAYNKSMYDETMIKYCTTDGASIYNNSKDGSGNVLYGDGTIVFVKSGLTVKIGNAGNIVIVGNDPENKNVATKTGTYLPTASDGSSKLVIANIDFDLANSSSITGAYYFTPNTNSAHFPELVFDNCDINLPDGKYLVAITADNRYLDRLVLNNCNVYVASGSSNRYIYHSGRCSTALEEAIFTNNVFYSDETAAATSFRLLGGNTYDNADADPLVVNNATAVDKLVAENNTFVNLIYQNYGMLIANVCSEASVKNNLVYVNQPGSNTNDRNFVICTTTYPTIVDCGDNMVFDTATYTGDSPKYSMYYHSTQGGENPQVLNETPFASTDYANGIFTQLPAYASYGAQR